MAGRALTDADLAYLHDAVRLAREAQQIGNLPVGAVISLDGAVIAEGRNSIWVPKPSPGRHAEIEALEAVAPELWVKAPQMTLYTTLEPCLMCTGAILLHRVGRVVFGSSDGRGGTSCIIGHMPPAFESLFGTIEWVGPALPQECDELNERVFELLMKHKNRSREADTEASRRNLSSDQM
jgi:tRNA(adenine34) deaminase